jgi:hypothetical protein
LLSSQVDGLHLKSGIPENQLAELHGNIYKEKCENCKKVYLRDFDVKGIGFRYTGEAFNTSLLFFFFRFSFCFLLDCVHVFLSL